MTAPNPTGTRPIEITTRGTTKRAVARSRNEASVSLRGEVSRSSTPRADVFSQDRRTAAG